MAPWPGKGRRPLHRWHARVLRSIFFRGHRKPPVHREKPGGTHRHCATPPFPGGLFRQGLACLLVFLTVAGLGRAERRALERPSATLGPIWASNNDGRSFCFNSLRNGYLSLSAGWKLPKALLLQPLQGPRDASRPVKMGSSRLHQKGERLLCPNRLQTVP